MPPGLEPTTTDADDGLINNKNKKATSLVINPTLIQRVIVEDELKTYCQPISCFSLFHVMIG